MPARRRVPEKPCFEWPPVRGLGMQTWKPCRTAPAEDLLSATMHRPGCRRFKIQPVRPALGNRPGIVESLAPAPGVCHWYRIQPG